MKDLRQKLLDVGFDLISEQGFAGIGLTKILNEANATKGSFYHHFKSKEDFGTTLLTDYFEDHLETLEGTCLIPKKHLKNASRHTLTIGVVRNLLTTTRSNA